MLDVRPARNAFVQILCSAYNVDVSAVIIILTLSTLHGRRVFDVHLFSVPSGQKQLSAYGVSVQTLIIRPCKAVCCKDRICNSQNQRDHEQREFQDPISLQ